MNPTFDEAVEEFEKFLAMNGYSPRIVWVTPADVVLTGKHTVYVKLPLPDENVESARKIYLDGMKRGFGEKFGTLCELKSDTCCYVWVPTNKTDAQYAMMPSGLKMNAGGSKRPAKGVYSRLKWNYLRFVNRKMDVWKSELFH
jgi:hypothetical protein